MKLALSFLISAVFHAAAIYLSLSFTHLAAEKEQLIPVAFLSNSEANGHGLHGDAKAEGRISKLNGVAGKRFLGAPLILKNKNEDGARESEMVQAAKLIAEQTPRDKTEKMESMSFVESFATDPESGPYRQAHAISQGGVGGGHGAGGLNGLGNSGTGMGFGGEGRGSGTAIMVYSRASYAHNPKPEYPERARREGWEGTVLLRVLVDQQGKPKRIEVSRGSGFDTLDRAAMETVKNWRFHPARYGEEQMESWVKVPIIFRLADRSS